MSINSLTILRRVIEAPEWQKAAARYFLAGVGVIVVAQDVMPQSAWDETVASLITLLNVGYGLLRTNQIENERDTARAYYERIAFTKEDNGNL